MKNKFKKFKRIKKDNGTIQYIMIEETNKTNDFKKYLDSFNWYDMSNKDVVKLIPPPVFSPEYPSNFESQFGKIPVVFLQISEKVIPFDKFLNFQKYLTSQGFDLVECGYTSFRYIHVDKRIMISGDSGSDTEEDKEEEEEPIYDLSNAPEAIYIHTIPTIENRKYIESFVVGINEFLIDVSKQVDKFYMIAEGQQGLFTQKTNFKSIPVLDDRFDLFYGKSFPHEKMYKFVTDKTENLMLLHGDPGTGKSNYIKHLITNSVKKVIYIPPSMLSVISSPGFVTFMMKNKNSILLIEDAEEVLSIDRNSATNNLLGLTDGFLKDALGLKVIATFNCDIAKIDPALMRKGRMYFEYKFDKLGVDDCRNLAAHMGIEKDIVDPMTLAEFFNDEDNTLEDSFQERRIGFG